MVGNDAMDIHGGKGICLGPRNYLGRGYQIVPVAITVEGANMLTRSLIIFGQGAIRCHPFVLREMNAARDKDKRSGAEGIRRGAVRPHRLHDQQRRALAGDGADARALLARAGARRPTQRFYQHINRFSASFAFATDVAMLTLGGYLKKKESLSARLGDVLSCMYLASMVLKHYREPGPPGRGPAAGRMGLPQPAVQGAGAAAQLPAQLPQSLRSPRSCGFFIFPRGQTYHAPSDPLGQRAGRADPAPDGHARPADARHLSHRRARQSARPAARSAGARRHGRSRSRSASASTA